MKIQFFKSGADFRRWLQAHHDKATELWLGFYKKDSGKRGITYAEALDEALCFGWIDGIKKRVDALSYTHRFTPRRPRSVWSRLNIQHAERLKRAGRMMPPGLKAFAARDPARSGLYSFENRPGELPPADARTFKADAAAWSFFQAQPPGYRRTATWWVLSAKQLATRARRLRCLIEISRAGWRLPQVSATKI